MQMLVSMMQSWSLIGKHLPHIAVWQTVNIFKDGYFINQANITVNVSKDAHFNFINQVNNTVTFPKMPIL